VAEPETLDSPNSERLEAVLAGLTTDQVRFVVARQYCQTDKEAAQETGIAAATAYSWPNKDDVNEAVRLMAYDGLVVAQHIRRRAVAKAMAVKVRGLDSDDEKVRQSAATEIIEWEMGKAHQFQEISGPAGGQVEVHIDLDKLTDAELAALADIAERIGGD